MVTLQNQNDCKRTLSVSKMNVGVMGIASPDGRRLERPSPSGHGLSLQAGAESLCLTGVT